MHTSATRFKRASRSGAGAAGSAHRASRRMRPPGVGGSPACARRMPADPTRARPRFAPSYGISADEEGMLDWSWAAERLAASRAYWIATTRDDGSPHVAPVWGLWHDDAVVFGTSP